MGALRALKKARASFSRASRIIRAAVCYIWHLFSGVINEYQRLVARGEMRRRRVVTKIVLTAGDRGRYSINVRRTAIVMLRQWGHQAAAFCGEIIVGKTGDDLLSCWLPDDVRNATVDATLLS